MAGSTSSSVRHSVGRGTGYSHSARKELAAVQTRGSSRAGQLQCGLRRRGAGSSRRAGRGRQAQAGGVPRIARGLEGKKINLVIVLLAEGKKINLAVGAQWHSKKRKKRAGSELGRGFEVRPSIGRRSSGGRSDRVKLRSPRPTSSQPSQNRGHRSISDRVPSLRGILVIGLSC